MRRPLSRSPSSWPTPIPPWRRRRRGRWAASAARRCRRWRARCPPVHRPLSLPFAKDCSGVPRRCPALRPLPSTTNLRALPNLPHHLRVAALRGRDPEPRRQGVPLMVEAIRTESSVPAADAIRISMDLPGAEVTQALVGELAEANEEKQILLLQTLGYRGDATAAPALVAAGAERLRQPAHRGDPQPRAACQPRRRSRCWPRWSGIPSRPCRARR